MRAEILNVLTLAIIFSRSRGEFPSGDACAGAFVVVDGLATIAGNSAFLAKCRINFWPNSTFGRGCELNTEIVLAREGRKVCKLNLRKGFCQIDEKQNVLGFMETLHSSTSRYYLAEEGEEKSEEEVGLLCNLQRVDESLKDVFTE